MRQLDKPVVTFPTLLLLLMASFACPSEEVEPDIRNLHSSNTIEEDLSAGMNQGKTIWLMSGDNKQYAIFTPSEENPPEGAAIILHDAGAHPDWPDVISPLRTGLTKHRWTTLSISWNSSGITKKNELTRENIAAPISDAITQLKQKGLKNIILIGHGYGALAALSYLSTSGRNSSDISGFIAIGINEPDTKKDSMILTQLKEVKVPTLDIFGEMDNPNVLATASKRKSIFLKGSLQRNSISTQTTKSLQNKLPYRQFLVPAADHSFHSHKDILLKRILGWTRRHTKGTTLVGQ